MVINYGDRLSYLSDTQMDLKYCLHFASSRSKLQHRKFIFGGNLPLVYN